MFSTSYHCYDLLSMQYFGLLESDSIFHHGSVILITLMLVITDQALNYWVGVLAMSEFSVPFLHVRLILRNLELSATKAYQFSETCYFACYFIGRAIIGAILVWQIMTCEKILLIFKIGGLPLWLRSLYVIYQMFLRVLQRDACCRPLYVVTLKTAQNENESGKYISSGF